MESAAGVGGIIKTVLALQHGEIPRHLHLRAIHGDIALQEIPAVVPTRHLTWPAGYEAAHRRRQLVRIERHGCARRPRSGTRQSDR